MSLIWRIIWFILFREKKAHREIAEYNKEYFPCVKPGMIFQNSGGTMNVEGLTVPTDTWVKLPENPHPTVDEIYAQAHEHMLKHNNINDCNAAGCKGCD